jgi:hypothetical protein
MIKISDHENRSLGGLKGKTTKIFSLEAQETLILIF